MSGDPFAGSGFVIVGRRERPWDWRGARLHPPRKNGLPQEDSRCARGAASRALLAAAGQHRRLSAVAPFLGDTFKRLPATARVSMVRADRGFCTHAVVAELEAVRADVVHDRRAMCAVAQILTARWRRLDGQSSSRRSNGWTSPTTAGGSSSRAKTPSTDRAPVGNCSTCTIQNSTRWAPICPRAPARVQPGVPTEAAPTSIPDQGTQYPVWRETPVLTFALGDRRSMPSRHSSPTTSA